jgi:hypothetical protein
MNERTRHVGEAHRESDDRERSMFDVVSCSPVSHQGADEYHCHADGRRDT